MNFKTAGLFLLIVSYSAVAEAAVIYSLELVAQGNTNPGTIQVNPASITTVSVFLRERVDGASILRLNDVNWGMATANFGVVRTASVGNNNITGLAKNTRFDVNSTLSFDPSTASFPLSVDALSPLVLGEAGTTTSRLFLGSFDVTGGTDGSSALFTVTQPAGGLNFTLGDGTGGNGPVFLDGSLGTLPSLTITAVPEPTSMLLVGMVGLGGFAARRWSNRRQKLAV